jgi:tetratricopeptide (TPR) repeat protein
LLSAEIALSQVAETRPSYYKAGLSFLSDGNHLPRQLTELAGAVATTELLDGSRRKAARFFRQSIVDPNGNALAQAEWATPAFGATLVSESSLRLADEAFEAKAFHLHRTGKFEDVPAVCNQWSSEEPFLIRPYEFGAQAANLIEDHETALLLARRGLHIRPNAAKLLNSAAFALANLGMLDEAEALLQRVKADADDDSLLVTEANRGLVAFRRGETELGTSLYKKAIDGFRYRQRTYLTTSARLYFAREALRAKIPQGEAAMSEAKRDLEKHKFPDLLRVAQQTEKHVESVNRGATPDLARRAQ